MRKFLSIVIPRYSETERELFPLLSSINGQIGVDFDDIEVIVSTDGGGQPLLSKGYVDLFYNLQIKQVKLDENRGPGVARQNGLDAALGDYVMFCDADDTLHNVGVLGALIEDAERESPDMLTSSWLEEIENDDGKMLYLTHEQENTWMHGKFLRRRFLQKNNIRFHPDLRVHEDSYFLSVASAYADKMHHSQCLSYVWKWSPNTITRRNNGLYSYDSVETFVIACTESFKIVEQVRKETMPYKVVQFVFYHYFSLHQPDWLDESKKIYRDAVEARLVERIAPFWHYYTEQTPEFISEVYNNERSTRFTNLIENETLYQWFDRLGLEYNK